MKKFLGVLFFFNMLNVSSNPSFDIIDDTSIIAFNADAVERITQRPFNELIADAEEKGTNYILAEVLRTNGMSEYFDGNFTHNFYEQSKGLAPSNEKPDAIHYYLLTHYENQKKFRFFISEFNPLIDLFFNANKGDLNSLLVVGNELAEQKRKEIALDFLIRAWQKGWYVAQWEAYKGFEKIAFPEEPENNFSLMYRKIFIGYHFLKDIFWP